MVLSSVSGIELATFIAKDFQVMYHLQQLMVTMDAPLTRPRNSANLRGILNNKVKELSKVKTTYNLYG